MNALPETAVSELIEQKLQAFEGLQEEMQTNFRFKQDVHGQKRFSHFPVEHTVHYLHALWVCECKDRLLSVYKNVKRYAGPESLRLLSVWQAGDTASVVAFLNQRLDMLPLPDITWSLQEARRSQAAQERDNGLARRLEHGRLIMLNRGFNLLHALDTIFALSEQQLSEQVREACIQYGHTPEQVEQQLAELELPLYAYVPHQRLAKANMVLMNDLSFEVMNLPADRPEERSWHVLEPTEEPSPFAEHVIVGYQSLQSVVYHHPQEKPPA